jgi:hypothetical protein
VDKRSTFVKENRAGFLGEREGGGEKVGGFWCGRVFCSRGGSAGLVF